MPIKGNGFEAKNISQQKTDKDIRFLRAEQGYKVYEVGSGDYSF